MKRTQADYPKIPAALRAAPSPPAARVEREQLHITLVIPDARLFKLLENHCYLIGPHYKPYDVKLHILLNESGTPIDLVISTALVESGLVDAEQANINRLEPTAGWPKNNG